MSAAPVETHTDPADGLTVQGGSAECEHEWAEMPERNSYAPTACDVCVNCGGVKQ